MILLFMIVNSLLTLKFRHKILIGPDPKDSTKVLTGIPLIHNISNQLVAFVEIMRGKRRLQQGSVISLGSVSIKPDNIAIDRILCMFFPELK